MEKKYELIKSDFLILYRIRALRSFGNVKEGDIGGYVESEENLSHDGNCWIYDDAKVSGNAKIFGNAIVLGDAKVFDDAMVYGDARISGNVNVSGHAKVYENAEITGYVSIKDNAEIYGLAQLYDYVEVKDDAKIFNVAHINERASIYGKAKVSGIAELYGDTRIGGDAMVSKSGDYIAFQKWWLLHGYFTCTWTKSNNMWADETFYGNSEELIKRGYEQSEKNGKCYENLVKYVNDFVIPMLENEDIRKENK